MYLSYILKELKIMEMKKSMMLIAMGVGGTLMYQAIRNGNAKKMIKELESNMMKMKKDVCDDLEDMM